MELKEEINLWIYFWIIPFITLAILRLIYLIIKTYKK